MLVQPSAHEPNDLGASSPSTGFTESPLDRADLHSTLQHVLATALQATGGARGSVVLVDPDHDELVILEKLDPDGPWPPPADQKVRLRFGVGEGIAGHVAKTGKLHYAPIAGRDPWFVRSQVRRTANWSLLAVPILARGNTQRKTIGVISIEGPAGRPGFFDARAKEILTVLANEAVVSIETAALAGLVQATLSSYRLRRILAVSQAVVSQQTLEQILEQIARIAFEELRADLLTLYRWNLDHQDFITPPIQLGDFKHPDDMNTQIHKGDVVDKVFHEWGSRYFQNAPEDPQLLSLGRVPPRDGQAARERFPVRESVASSAILRLDVGVKRVGVLCVNWHMPHAFDQVEKAVLEIFANHVALAIENDRLMRAGIEQATRDQRERLHRDLHDDVGGKLTAVKHLAATARTILHEGMSSDLSERLQEIENMMIEAHGEVRKLLADLEPRIGRDLQKDLTSLCDVFSTDQCQVRCALRGSLANLRPGIAEGVYRIAREAIHNAKQHSTATQIDVNLNTDTVSLVLEIIDNGKGAAPLPREERRRTKRYGLTIMEQLAYTIGGDLEIGLVPDQGGWRVWLLVPSPLGAIEGRSIADTTHQYVEERTVLA